MRDKILEKPLLNVIFIVFLGFLTYSNTFDVPFQFDDYGFIVQNPIIRDFSYYFTDLPFDAGYGNVSHTGKTRTVGFLTFLANYKLHGLNVWGYHAVNILIHVVNAILVYFLLILTFKTPLLAPRAGEETRGYKVDDVRYIALVCALLFVSHPVQTQAVTYISQRFASLTALFYLGSLVLYIKWRLKTERQSYLYFLSLFCAVLAVKTKENAVTLPVTLALFEALFFNGRLLRRFLRLLPMALTVLLVIVPALDTGGLYDDTRTIVSMPRLDYLFTEFRVIVTYIRLLLFPVDQNLDYDYPVYDSFLMPEVFLSFGLLSSFVVLGFHLLKRGGALRLLAFGIFWFFITLSVEAGLIPLEVIYEHRLYLPSAGAFLAITIGGFLLFRRFGTTGFRKTSVAVIAVLIIAVMAISAYERNKVWQSEISLWEDVVRKSPEKYRARNNLGMFYAEAGQVDKAIETFRYALKLSPDSAEGHCNLANAYLLNKRYYLALEHYLISLRLKPGSYKTLMNIATAYRTVGLPDEAERYQQEANRIKRSLPGTF